MIQNKQDLKFYLEEDCYANIGTRKISWFKLLIKKIYRSDSGMAYDYLRCLRKYEYALNTHKSLYGKIYVAWRRFLWHRASYKYNLIIYPNTVGYGLYIPHIIGGGIIINCQSMGCYCVANANILVGNKETNENRATIGDYVNICTGAKVIGKVHIGNNVTIAPNAVVVKDVCDNYIVGGVPAKNIKLKTSVSDDICRLS